MPFGSSAAVTRARSREAPDAPPHHGPSTRGQDVKQVVQRLSREDSTLPFSLLCYWDRRAAGGQWLAEPYGRKKYIKKCIICSTKCKKEPAVKFFSFNGAMNHSITHCYYCRCIAKRLEKLKLKNTTTYIRDQGPKPGPSCCEVTSYCTTM